MPDFLFMHVGELNGKDLSIDIAQPPQPAVDYVVPGAKMTIQDLRETTKLNGYWMQDGNVYSNPYTGNTATLESRRVI